MARGVVMRYWLLKSEPEAFGWEDLVTSPDQTARWDGVRNFQARNYLRAMRVGDYAFFYHSSSKPNAIVGIVRVVRAAYPDPTQFDLSSPYFDPKSDPEDPRWTSVDVQAVKPIEPPIERGELRRVPALSNMVLLNNTRLSVQPVSASEWAAVLCLRRPHRSAHANSSAQPGA